MSASPDTAIGCIDHVVIVADDLDRGAEIYRRLGFTLSPKGVHSAAMGSANHTIMLQNDYFELLSVLAPTDRNARWRQALATGGGVAGIALTTRDPDGARAHWLAQGLSPGEPNHFSREVVRQDGAKMEARFEVVSLAEVPGTGVRIFVCSQPTREAVWLPELMTHANTAQAIIRVTFACADPAAAATQWQRVIPSATVATRGDGIAVQTSSQELLLLAADAAQASAAGQPRNDSRVIGITYKVADLDACKVALTTGGIAHHAYAGEIRVPAQAACNVALTFALTA